ncbi:MAG TPA: Uma2 family endonuclease [Gemmatimonadales bacterium]|nr:Uma2 family endonuclease [Gemmatimonadales bacterium]
MPAERAYVPGMSSSTLMTADELLQVRIPDKHVELVRGVLVVREPPGYTHGRVTVNLAVRLAAQIDTAGSGQVLVVETGFKVARNPDTVRGPDLAVLRRDQVPVPEPRGFLDLAPELVVEVLSPGDRPGEVLARVADWLSAGTRLVWVIDPGRRLCRVYRQDGSETLLTGDDALDGEDVVPGFSCPLSAVL